METWPQLIRRACIGRASSDLVAFSESLYNSDIMTSRFAAEEERYSAQGGAPPGAHTLRIEIPDYNG